MSARVDAVLEVLRELLSNPLADCAQRWRQPRRHSAERPFAHAGGSRLWPPWWPACTACTNTRPSPPRPAARCSCGPTLSTAPRAPIRGGTVLALPGIHQVRRYSTRDQVYRLTEGASATGSAPFQSTEGLSIGVDLSVRWAVDRSRVAQMSKDYPDDLNADLVRPAVQGIAYPVVRPVYGAGDLRGSSCRHPA